MYKLVISDDEGNTTHVPLVRQQITIGRKEGNTIRLTERNVSRRHARLVKSNGSFAVEDLSSYNGVRVNGTKIDAEQSLKAGDKLTIGDYIIALQTEGVEEVADVPTKSLEVGEPTTPDQNTAMIQAPSPYRDTPPPPARLVMLSPPAPGAEFALSKDTLRIGRAEDLGAWVNHRSISREHAEILREGDTWRIVDLGSANGVRVNGQDKTTAPLTAGDVIELGQVRFRFVGEGEKYVFEADQTIQMEPVALAQGVPKAPIFVAVGIIGLAVVVALGFAIFGGDEPEPDPVATVVPSEVRPPDPAGEVEPPATDEDEFAEALRACRESLDGLQPQAAVAHAERAIALNADSYSARQCKQQAEVAVEHVDVFRQGLASFGESDWAGAVMHFDTIPDTSVFASREEIARARENHVADLLGQARRGLRSDPLMTLRQADAVLNYPHATEEQSTSARELRDQGERARRGEVVASARPPAPAVTMNPVQRPDPPTMDTPPAPSRSGSEAIDACQQTGNFNQCVVRAVVPRTSYEYSVVIRAHQELGNQGPMRRYMGTYLERFPQGPRANQYRQVIDR